MKNCFLSYLSSKYLFRYSERLAFNIKTIFFLEIIKKKVFQSKEFIFYKMYYLANSYCLTIICKYIK